MRTSLFVIALVGAGCLNHASPADPSIESTFPRAPTVSSLPRDLHVVTFNVHMETGANVVRMIQGDPSLRDADLIVLEEIHRPGTSCSAACALGKALGYYAIYAPGHVNGNGTDGVAIVSRAPITSAQVIVLPPFDVHISSGRRIAMAAKIDQDGHPITVYAVHLENRLNVRDRKRQMLPVLADAERQSTPVIIAGDFNTNPFTWIAHVIPILTMTQATHLEKLVRAHGFTTPVANSGPTSRWIGMKLDAIYTRGFQTYEFATAHGLDISDHLALWARMTASD